MTTLARALPGVGTLFAAPHAAIDDLQPGDYAVYGIPYDLSTEGLAGARHGPQACRDASQYYAVFRPSFEEVTTGRAIDFPEVIDLGDAPVRPLDWDDTRPRLAGWIAGITARGAIPVGIGGDYFATSVLAPSFAASVAARGGSAAFLRLSSHLDLGEEHPVLGVFWHGRTTRTILESGALAVERTALFGANGYVPDSEWAFAARNNVPVIPLHEARRTSPAATVRDLIAALGVEPRDLYVSIDLDVVDGAYVPDTDDPVFGGLSNVELLGIADAINAYGFGAIDITGLNPHVEPSAITGARFAAWLVLRLIGRQRPLEVTGA